MLLPEEERGFKSRVSCCNAACSKGGRYLLERGRAILAGVRVDRLEWDRFGGHGSPGSGCHGFMLGALRLLYCVMCVENGKQISITGRVLEKMSSERKVR